MGRSGADLLGRRWTQQRTNKKQTGFLNLYITIYLINMEENLDDYYECWDEEAFEEQVMEEDADSNFAVLKEQVMEEDAASNAREEQADAIGEDEVIKMACCSLMWSQ